ncbi:MAG: c-type cytochrome [Bacteroidia bacterium]
MNKLCKKLHNPLVAAIAFVLTLASPNLLNAANADNGAKVFKANCATCHSTGTNKVTGPGLQDVTKRVPQPYAAWMHKWIKNNAAVIQSGDEYAKKIFDENNHTAMTVFDGVLTDAQIDDVIEFLANPPKQEATANAGTSATGGTENTGENKSSGSHAIWYVVIGFLFIIVLVLRTVRKSLQIVANVKKGEPVPPDTTVWQDIKSWIYHHKTKFAVICIFFFALSTVYGWEYLWNIDVTPGYHPSQPINFLHKVHAGDNSIACLYCHSGAEKGKVAGIPTLNVCMNCHRGIQGSTPEYQKEIAKIYYAVGWDPEKAEYSKPPHPVQWNRVHALPDFAYFNHSQHVVVGKVECEKCHGDVKTFTTDKQFAPLTMGWCINCHRETPVQMEGNGYYAKLHQAIAKKFGEDKKVTEADMGGLECGKCHY